MNRSLGTYLQWKKQRKCAKHLSFEMTRARVEYVSNLLKIFSPFFLYQILSQSNNYMTLVKCSRIVILLFFCLRRNLVYICRSMKYLDLESYELKVKQDLNIQHSDS